MCSLRPRIFPGTRPPCGRDRDNVGVDVVRQADEIHPDVVTAGFAIVVDGLRKAYGSLVAVDGISFRVKEREIFGLLGPNGAGKTTTVEILEGLREADDGRALVAGIDVRKERDRVKSLIGVQLQSSAFFDGLSLLELLDMFAALYGRSVDAMAILKKVDLAEKARSQVNKLSGGQKQRFSIATALVNEPRILFLDEPTTGLDPQARRNLWELADSIRAEGRTIVLTTHYMDEAETLCDRVAIMDHGKILALEPPDTLIQRLIDKGFKGERVERTANLEDVFLDMTGHGLREA
jgi:ABC-2 type transport system ATP-binding protein